MVINTKSHGSSSWEILDQVSCPAILITSHNKEIKQSNVQSRPGRVIELVSLEPGLPRHGA